jgi:hypothetical protein
MIAAAGTGQQSGHSQPKFYNFRLIAKALAWEKEREDNNETVRQ